MKLSVGLWDSLFGEKVTIELKDEKGNPLKREMTKKFYDKMIMEGKMSRVMSAKVFNVINGLFEIHYTWNEVISEEIYYKFLDKDSGLIHIVEFYKEGELQRIAMTKEKFKEAMIQMENV